MTTRWYSLEGLIDLTDACARLIQQLWMVAQRRYIGAEREMIWRPQPTAATAGVATPPWADSRDVSASLITIRRAIPTSSAAGKRSTMRG